LANVIDSRMSLIYNLTRLAILSGPANGGTEMLMEGGGGLVVNGKKINKRKEKKRKVGWEGFTCSRITLGGGTRDETTCPVPRQ
jgi:hypothetical protein